MAFRLDPFPDDPFSSSLADRHPIRISFRAIRTSLTKLAGYTMGKNAPIKPAPTHRHAAPPRSIFSRNFGMCEEAAIIPVPRQAKIIPSITSIGILPYLSVDDYIMGRYR